MIDFLDGLVSHFVLDDGRLVVAHAGLREDMQGRASGAVRSFALYGDTTGETDHYGLPVRYPWAEDYRGPAAVVYGHTPVPDAVWLNNTICIDTGCVFGGRLTALRYPERQLVAVPARRTYWEPARPLTPAPAAEDGRAPSDLDIDDVLGKRIVTTRLGQTVTVREENAIAALEVMSRFAADPPWLVYLPPTMAPIATTQREGLLEHPTEAFASFRRDGVTHVVCEEKHMGSRAVLVVCRDQDVAARRFDVADHPAAGAIVTRTGRPFLTDTSQEAALRTKVRSAISAAGLWDELGTDWLVLETELLPWSAKAGELLRRQVRLGRGVRHRHPRRRDRRARRHRGAGGRRRGSRCPPPGPPCDGGRVRRRLPPLLLARRVHRRPSHRAVLDPRRRRHCPRLTDHRWHLDILGRLSDSDPGTFRATAYVLVDLTDDASQAAGVAWWEQLTAAGGEGMVVKPVDVVHRGPHGNTQPGIKCRGPEYLRIIYGPEYTAPENLTRLRSRGLGHKRSLALREFALGIEALERFVSKEPLFRVHECVFVVVALESEPVDPRL